MKNSSAAPQKHNPTRHERGVAANPAGRCRVCRTGKVVADVRREFDTTFGPVMIGPGSASQSQEVSHGFYCTNCGIKYQFVPEDMRLA